MKAQLKRGLGRQGAATKKGRLKMSKEFAGVTNACCLHAMRAVSGLTEKRILKVCRIYGFNNHGMHRYQWIKAMKELGIELAELGINSSVNFPYNTPTLTQFAKSNPKGAFYVTVSQHAFAVRDGRVIDNLKFAGGRRRVIYAFRVINPSPEKNHVNVSDLERDPVLEILQFGANPHGRNEKTKMWWKLYRFSGSAGTFFRHSEVSDYFNRNYIRIGIKYGQLRALEGNERTKALKKIAKLRYEDEPPSEWAGMRHAQGCIETEIATGMG